MDATDIKRFVDRINELEAELAERDEENSILESRLSDVELELQVAKAQLSIAAREQKYVIDAVAPH